MIKTNNKPSHFQTYMRGHKRALLEGFIMPWKTPLKSIMTLLTLSICFYIPLFLWTLWLNYDELKQSWQNQGSIAVFVASGLDLKQAGILLQEIKDNKVVKYAGIKSSVEIKQQLNSDVQLSQFMELIDNHDLPQQISIKIRESATLKEIETFVNAYEINPQVEYISYDRQWISQLQALTNTLLQMARISALMFALIIMVILGNAITNEISDHKNELKLLELIGATWAQVRRSFLYMGIFLGIYAGLLAVIYLTFSFWWLQDTLGALIKNFGIDISLHGLNVQQIMWVIGLSITVTWLTARLALSSQSFNQIKD